MIERIEEINKIDPKTAKKLGSLTERVYGGTYYVDGFTGDGQGWIDDGNMGKITFLAIDQHTNIIGVSCVYPNKKSGVALLCDTMVHPSFSNNGVGNRLNSERIKFLENNPDLIGIVENRAHQPGSYMPLIKHGGFVPLALTPDDALKMGGSYLREYYLLSIRVSNPNQFMRLNITCSDAACSNETFAFPFTNIVLATTDHNNNPLVRHYSTTHELFNRPTKVKGAIKVITSPKDLDTLDFDSTITTIIYMTSLDVKTYEKLFHIGFRFNGIRPWINLTTADGRVHNGSEPIDSFFVFSRVAQNDNIIVPDFEKIRLDGLNEDTLQILKFLFNSALS